MRQEEQQCRTFAQLPLQEAGLSSWGLHPLEDGLEVFEHPAADGLRREVMLPSGENLKDEAAHFSLRPRSYHTNLTSDHFDIF